MGYRFEEGESAKDGIRRIASEQVKKALDELGDSDLDPHQRVHQLRKRCKKIRAAARLVRDELGQAYSEENGFFRDLAREVSDARDAQVAIETFDGLLERYSAEVRNEDLGFIREALLDRRRKVTEGDRDLAGCLDQLGSKLSGARSRVESWPVKSEGFDAIEGGLKRTYKRGRKAMHTAYGEPSMETFHEWRKRVKYHRYHARMLVNVWPEGMDVRRASLHRLSDLLGDDHDLAELRQLFFEHPEEMGTGREAQIVVGLVVKRRGEMEVEALSLGERLYAEKPKHLARRFRCYWDCWRATEA